MDTIRQTWLSLSLNHENVQAHIGLDCSTRVDVLLTDVHVYVSIVGLGFNADFSVVGIRTRLGNINLKCW